MTQIADGALAALMPLHLRLGAAGDIRAMGAAMARLIGADALGAPWDRYFAARPARGAVADWPAQGRMMFDLLPARGTQLRGQAVAAGDGVVLNLSFGIGVVDAVARFGLTAADFAATDLAVELLYLVEAKTLVMAEMNSLNNRLQAAQQVAAAQAVTDALTGLGNRRALASIGAALVRQGRGYGVVHVDLDHFKAVNDTLGHAAGDHVLQQVAAVLRAETRRGDHILRLGGDEFLILLPDLADLAALQRLGRRLVRRLSRPLTFQGQECRIGASLGMGLAPAGCAPDAVIEQVDAALYAAKAAGRGRAVTVPLGPA